MDSATRSSLLRAVEADAPIAYRVAVEGAMTVPDEMGGVIAYSRFSGGIVERRRLPGRLHRLLLRLTTEQVPFITFTGVVPTDG